MSRRKRIWILVLLLSTCGLVWWSVQPRERLLLNLATRRMELPFNSFNQPNRSLSRQMDVPAFLWSFRWVSNQEILYVWEDVIRYKNLITGQERPLPSQPNPRFRFLDPRAVGVHYPGEGPDGRSGWAIPLPDASVLIWYLPAQVPFHTPTPLLSEQEARTIDPKLGHTYARFSLPWQPDEQGPPTYRKWKALIPFKNGWNILKYDLDKPDSLVMERCYRDPSAPTTLDGPYPFIESPVRYQRGSASADNPRLPLGIAANGSALTLPSDPPNTAYSKGIMIEAFEASQPGPESRKLGIDLPTGVLAYPVVLSPQGDRIAWIQRATHPPSIYARFLHRIAPSVSIDTKVTWEIWTCRLDGTDRKEIGHTPPQVNRSHQEEPFSGLAWSPDGKLLSFIYQYALYTVPAD